MNLQDRPTGRLAGLVNTQHRLTSILRPEEETSPPTSVRRMEENVYFISFSCYANISGSKRPQCQECWSYGHPGNNILENTNTTQGRKTQWLEWIFECLLVLLFFPTAENDNLSLVIMTMTGSCFPRNTELENCKNMKMSVS